MMLEAGLTPPDVRNQQLQQHMTTMMQLANQWEEMQGMMRYRDALTGKMQQDAAFEAQMQPLRIQAEQQAVAAGQQSATTVHPAMSAADLKSLGVPDDLAAQYEGHQLTSADFAALKDLSAAGQTKIFDYGQDGTGQGKGQWLVDRNFNPIKQLSAISETGRATALAKQQAAQQAALLKGMTAPVYAYDPQQKATVLTTLTQANQGGMQNIRGVKNTDIEKDLHDTRVLNDVAVKANNVMDTASAMDSWNPLEKQAVANILSSTGKDSNLELGLFGARFPTATINTMMNSESWHALASNPQAQKYVMGVLSLREASMGLQRVLTGTARANESQINALQSTLPGLEISGDLVGQKLNNFTQNIDMLRQGIPRMAGIDVVPTKQWSGRQSSVLQSTGQPQGQAPTGGPLNTGAGMALSGVSAVTALGSRIRRSLGLE